MDSRPQCERRVHSRLGLGLLIALAGCDAATIEGKLDPLRGAGEMPIPEADAGSSLQDSGGIAPSYDAGPQVDASVGLDATFPDAARYPDAQPPIDMGPLPNDGWPPELAESERALLVLMNDFRSTSQRCGGRTMAAVGPLTMQENLLAAARDHSQDMGEQNYFDHNSLDGRSPWDRISQAGYPGRGVAENIAAGNASAQATFQQWVNSPGHCVNMMSAQANEVGIGHASVPGSQFRHYWTQAFGRN